MNQLNKPNNDKSLSDLFKEVQDIRYGRAQAQTKAKETKDPRADVKFNKIYVIDKKFNMFGAIIGILDKSCSQYCYWFNCRDWFFCILGKKLRSIP